MYKRGREIPTIDVTLVTIEMAAEKAIHRILVKQGAAILDVEKIIEINTGEGLPVGIALEEGDVQATALAAKLRAATYAGYEVVTGTENPLEIVLRATAIGKKNPITIDLGASSVKIIVNTETFGWDEVELGFDTYNKIGVETQSETQDAVKLIVKGILRAQKPEEVVVTGTALTLSDNVFTPELVEILQGGTIFYDAVATDKIVGYEPPRVGEKYIPKKFVLNAYSTEYDEAGEIVQYEKVSYPNCTGTPASLSSEDGAFRAPEYTINSKPAKGQAPYKIAYVDELPVAE